MINIKSISEKEPILTREEYTIKVAKRRAKSDATDFDIAAEAIMFDCLDRKGIKLEFKACDEEVLEEIKDTWAKLMKACIEAQRNGGWNYNLEEMPIDIDCLCLTDANKVCIAVKDDSFNIISRGLITDSRYSNTVVAWAKLPPVKE